MCTVESALKSDIKISEKQFWTDSTINLYRIRNARGYYKPFVENRLEYIRQRSENWYYVPTDLNPADLPSRGCLPHELAGNVLWENGPKFQCDPNFKDYSTFERNLHSAPWEENVSDPELKTTRNKIENSMLNAETITNIEPSLDEIIDLSKYSDINELLRVTALVLKFVRGKHSDEECTLDDARKLWIVSEQLKDSKENADFRKTKANLRIYTEDGVMRCRGRISNSELPYDTKFPIYIPSRDY